MATQVPNTRLVRDASLTVTKALPSAGSNNNSPTIDLGTGPWHPEEIEIEIVQPAFSAHTDSTKNVTLTLQHSSDDSSYSSTDDGIGSLPAVTLTTPGVSSAGTVARTARVKLPAGLKRYIQFNQAVSGSGPNLTALSITYTVLN